MERRTSGVFGKPGRFAINFCRTGDCLNKPYLKGFFLDFKPKVLTKSKGRVAIDKVLVI